MVKRLIILVVLLTGALLVGRAQDTAEREIYTVLSYGDGVFEPEQWLASAREENGRTTAEWRDDDISGLAYLGYIHFDNPIQPDQIPLVFTEDWFNAVFANYQGIVETSNCQLDEVTLHEFNVLQAGVRFSVRYWIEHIDENRVLTLFLMFPSADPENMNTYAERLFPDAPICAG
ncbi:MAG: hypothetical protein LCI00_10940 [Chloroflexi bacterium]|nr:hypothetical protein [Chloroflexota bacterium]MCC6892044.1 hypothetical protein [Anaerolineae bacterium]